MSEPSIQTSEQPGQLRRTGIPVVDHILTPGSSLTSSTFRLVLDLAFICLFLVLLGLLALTGSIHFAVLIFIEFGLWTSVKWYVAELSATPKEAGVNLARKDQ